MTLQDITLVVSFLEDISEDINMSEQKKVKAVIHGERVGPEEQAKFTRTLTVEEIIQIITNGVPGRKLLLQKRKDPDDNVVVEYK